MGGLVTQKERQALNVDFAVGVETVVLQADGALREPMRLRHFGDEQFLGGAGGLVLGEEHGQKRIEGGGVFPRDDDLTARETVFDRITRRSQFAFRAAWSGRILGVLAIDFNAASGGGRFCETKPISGRGLAWSFGCASSSGRTSASCFLSCFLALRSSARRRLRNSRLVIKVRLFAAFR
jgi:hypothetical protein